MVAEVAQHDCMCCMELSEYGLHLALEIVECMVGAWYLLALAAVNSSCSMGLMVACTMAT